jgi:hypothetical protein
MKTKEYKFTVIAVKWFDMVNGNTYHSVRCVRHKDGVCVFGTFRYGYGDHYKQTALDEMFDAGWFKNYKRKVLAGSTVSDKTKLVSYRRPMLCLLEREQDYPILWTVSAGLKRDCIANGRL